VEVIMIWYTNYKLSQSLSKNMPRIVPPSDSVHEVMDATYNYGVLIGNEMANINTLEGGVDLADQNESKRVKDLIAAIASPQGYFSRIIVAQDGTVLEGQHRLEAARMLGWSQVPIVRVADFGQVYNARAMEQAAFNSGLRGDQVAYLIRQAMETIRKAGSPQKAMKDYDMPPQYAKAWQSVLQAAGE
jgi:hypothetical protein